MGTQRIFDHVWIDAVAAALDNLLGPSSDPDETVSIDTTEIAGIEPTALEERLLTDATIMVTPNTVGPRIASTPISSGSQSPIDSPWTSVRTALTAQ